MHNERGELIAYAGRAIDGQEPKYRFPAGFRTSFVLFNLHRALATGARTAIVQTLGVRMAVSAISLEDGRQPDQLAPGEIQHLLTSYDAGGRRLC